MDNFHRGHKVETEEDSVSHRLERQVDLLISPK